MKLLKLLKFTHANTLREIYISKELLFGFYHSEADKCTHLLATGGAICPVKESLDNVRKVWHDGKGKTKRTLVNPTEIKQGEKE